MEDIVRKDLETYQEYVKKDIIALQIQLIKHPALLESTVLNKVLLLFLEIVSKVIFVWRRQHRTTQLMELLERYVHKVIIVRQEHQHKLHALQILL